MNLGRRALLGGIGAGAVIGGASWVGCGVGRGPAKLPGVGVLADALHGLTAADAPRWLRETLASGAPIDAVLGAVTLAVTRSPLADADLHARLAPGAAARLGPASEDERRRLALWVVLQALPWLDPSAAPSAPPVPPDDAVDGLAEAATFAVVDAHPTIYAAEAAYWSPRLADEDRAWLIAAARARLDEAPTFTRAMVVDGASGRAAELAGVAAGGGRPEHVIAVARAALGAGEEAVDAVADLGREAGLDAVWAGLWLAAASVSGAAGRAINDVHALTVTGALHRLSGLTARDHPRRWNLALTAAARLALDAPRVDPAVAAAAWRFDGPPAPIDAVRARALRPGVDVHDLKYREALLACAAALGPAEGSAVIEAASRGGGVPDSAALPGFDAAVAELDAR